MLLYYAITTIHVLVCLILILVVLLQSGKGADLAGAFGGAGTQTAFGSRGPASFLSKMTTVAAILFMITSLALSMIGTKRESKSILDDTRGTVAPAKKAPAAAKQQTAPPSPEQIRQLQEEIYKKQKEAASASQAQPQGAEAPAPGKQQPPPAPAEAKPAVKDQKPPSGQKP